MLFRRRSRSHDSPVVQILGDCSVQLSPIKDDKTNKSRVHREAFVIPSNIPNISHSRGGSSDESYRSSDSSPDRSPQSRKAQLPKPSPESRLIRPTLSLRSKAMHSLCSCPRPVCRFLIALNHRPKLRHQRHKQMLYGPTRRRHGRIARGTTVKVSKFPPG
jgi:hypothetical protein